MKPELVEAPAVDLAVAYAERWEIWGHRMRHSYGSPLTSSPASTSSPSASLVESSWEPGCSVSSLTDTSNESSASWTKLASARS